MVGAMLRSKTVGLMLVLACGAPGFAQVDAGLESYFTGRQVVMKIDMPGTQKGVDLKFNKPVPMDWNEYSSRIKTSGISIHKGEAVRVTKFVVKNDMIELQLAGGGFGTAGDDTNTTISAPTIPKSQYEKDVEKQISNTTDAKRKRDLQQDLDRERSRRERMDAANQTQANIASQYKAQQVAAKRLTGGSRFNLRWQGSVPSDTRNPEAVMQLLAEYVDFDPNHAGSAPQPSPMPAPVYAPQPQMPQQQQSQYGAPAGGSGGSGDASQLKRGMRIDEVAYLIGRGRMMSQSMSNEGLKTQTVEYTTPDSVVTVTYVEGVVVRYSMNSR